MQATSLLNNIFAPLQVVKCKLRCVLRNSAHTLTLLFSKSSSVRYDLSPTINSVELVGRCSLCSCSLTTGWQTHGVPSTSVRSDIF